jgi:hypothetical protein
MWPILNYIKWSFEALADGKHPASDSLGRPWDPIKDAVKHSLGGKDMGMKACVLYVKGDWSEFNKTMAFPNFNHGMFPCIWCHTSADDMKTIADLSLPIRGEPYAPTIPVQYEEACMRCEIMVNVPNILDHRKLRGCLEYDARQGARGRVLTRAYVAHGIALQEGDRLEPSMLLHDVGDFDEDRREAEYPFVVMFWRPSLSTLCHHRNPMLNQALGIGPQHFAPDVLHCLALGVYQTYCAHAFWTLFDADAWSVPRHMGQGERIAIAISRVKMKIDAWQAQRRSTKPGVHSDIQTQHDLSKLFGTYLAPALALKAAESKTMMQITHSMVEEFARLVPPGVSALGRALVKNMKVMDSAGWRLSDEQYQDLIARSARATKND